MSNIPCNVLEKEIFGIVNKADLTQLTAKDVRRQLEQRFKCNFLLRKKEIDAMVMACVNSQHHSDESDNDCSGKFIEDQAVKVSKSPLPKKKKRESSDSGDSESELASKKNRSNVSTSCNQKSSNRNHEDSGLKTKKKASGKASGKGKGNNFTRAYKLSPELSKLMGADALPRHEVVKKMWAMIKERNLYDPNNKQFAICDEDLMVVIGVKRFRTFAMLKYLKKHFLIE